MVISTYDHEFGQNCSRLVNDTSRNTHFYETTVEKDTLRQVTAVQYAPLLTAVHKDGCNVKVPHVVQHLHYSVEHAHREEEEEGKLLLVAVG